MKLGFITCHFPPDSVGGGQVQSMRLCEALSKKYKVTVFTRAYKKGLPRKESSGAFTIQRRQVIKVPAAKSIIDVLKVLSQINTYKREIRIYISFHIQLASLMVIIAKLFFGTKAIVSPRGFEDFDFKWYKRSFQKFVYKNADIILIQSEKIKHIFCLQIERYFSTKRKEAINNKIRILPNGISVPENLPHKLSDRPDEILFVGRLEPIKGVAILLEALRLCDRELHLKIIGDGSQRDYLKSMAEGLRVSFLGMCKEEEIKRHLKNAKALILPSLSENLPNVILEAFCEGVPVIASNVGAIPELIEDGVNGYLISPSAVSELSEKINVLFRNENDLNRMGENSFQKVQSYNWSHILNQFDSIIANN